MAVRSLRDGEARQRILERISRLAPDCRRRWGVMDSDLLLPHLARGLRRALGEIPTRPPANRLRAALLRIFFVHHLPWPEGRMKAPPGAFDLAPTSWEADRETLTDLIERFATARAEDLGAFHPSLGRMSARDWDVLMYRHLDHHLRQFGVWRRPAHKGLRCDLHRGAEWRAWGTVVATPAPRRNRGAQQRMATTVGSALERIRT